MIVPYADAPAGVVERLARRCLDLPEDAGETDAIVDRLLEPPAGRRVVRLVTADGNGVVFASVGDNEPAVGYLDLVMVEPASRRRGRARALVSAAERELATAGVGEVRIAGNAPCYAWPGIDVRYTPAVCAALALGYTETRTAVNMTVDLDTLPDGAAVSAAEAQLAGAGIAVRAAGIGDIPALDAFIGPHFGAGWMWEAAEAVRRAGCHIATRDGRLLGFAAWGALRPSLFGPMGTDPAARGTGVGGLLLLRCLHEQRAAGLASAQIGWAGPIAFYSSAVGARIGRVFRLYSKTLP